jgi:hypothetical protein
LTGRGAPPVQLGSRRELIWSGRTPALHNVHYRHMGERPEEGHLAVLSRLTFHVQVIWRVSADHGKLPVASPVSRLGLTHWFRAR